MTDWLYKATRKKGSFEDTRDLAVNEGFLCRSAFNRKNRARAANTRHVKLGDILYIYFTGDGAPKVIGSFQVVGPDKHANPHRFGKGVTGTCLFEVADPTFERRLCTMGGNEGYELDPILKKMTGWILLARTDVATPPYTKALFKYKATLVRRSLSHR